MARFDNRRGVYKGNILSILVLSFLVSCSGFEQKTKPPVAQKIRKELTTHGQTRIDDYYWLNDRNNPQVLAYLEAENVYTDVLMAHTDKLQQKLYQEISGRIKQTDESVPYKKNGYYYYTRFESGQEYPVYCRKKGTMEPAEEIMLNVNKMAQGYAYYHVSGRDVSKDNTILAFGVDTLSRRKYFICFKNLASGEMLPDKLENTTGSVAWANDNKTVFYTVKDESLRPYKILRHVLGTDVSADAEVYAEVDVTFNAYVYKTRSDQYLMIQSTSTLSTEYRYLEADHPLQDFKILQPREKDLEYSVDNYQDKFYILTNYQAKNFRLIETPVNKTSRENWKDVVAHRDTVLLESFEVFKDYLVVQERIRGLQQLRIFDWKKKDNYYMNFREATYEAGISTNPDFDTPVVRYEYSSLTTPHSTFDYNMQSKEQTLLKQDEVLGNFKPENYQSERIYAMATDGVKVPVSLVYRKDLKRQDTNPLLLYGYGSYGASMDPAFHPERLSLLDRGFIFAIAHIRGGQEMGRDWYDKGKLLYKKNSFTDFVACAENLVAQKYTESGKLFAMGGSAGGLLMGAVVNLRPDLFKGVIAAVPYVDVVTTMLDPSIPLTTAEYDEWGNPNQKEDYDYMLSYSPYDNVEAKNYPALLVTTGLHDSQVQYWEPAKWVAKLRAMKTDKNLLILKTDMASGHGGASGRFARYKIIAFEYAFLLDLAGINN